MNDKVRVGIVGTGLMGRGLVRNVVGAGYGLSFLRRPGSASAAELEELGARPAERISDLVQVSDVLLLCVRGTSDVESIMLDAGGVLDSTREGLVVIDFTTALPASTRKLAELMMERGGRFIDAAMTGLPPDAERGEVNLIAGCNREDLGAALQILEAVSQKIYFTGSVGAGHAIKLLHQSIVLGNVALLAEAFACAGKNGLDTSILCEVIGGGGADSKAFQRLRPTIEGGEAGGFNFSLDNARKDMDYYCAFAAQSGTTTFISGPVFNNYVLATRDGAPDQSVPALLDFVAELNAAKS